jgi:hypothetical protein
VTARRLALLGVLLVASLALPVATRAAEPTFGTPTYSSTFGDAIHLTQPVTIDGAVDRVEVLVTFADAIGPVVYEVPVPSTTGAVTLTHDIPVTGEDHLHPNTPIVARWRLTMDGKDQPVEGPEVSGRYADDRFQWQTLTGDIVRVHWYEGSQAFGQRALQLGEQAIADTEQLLGVHEDQPVDFFIYADQASFYDALGPGTRENVGGQANTEIRTLFALIPPGQIDDAWVGIVIPHELVHLVFDTAAANPYHFPPRWLNEGLAVYQSQGYVTSDRALVERTAKDGGLIPLVGLGGQFPTTQDGFFLAYAESVSAVDYLVRTHGQDALVTLVRSYADGRTDDEAFSAALGVDLAGFDEAWLADLGAAPPVRTGPQPAPPGPVPAGWAAAPAVPGASALPAASNARPAPRDAGAGATIVLVVTLLIVLVAVIALVLRRRRPAVAA